MNPSQAGARATMPMLALVAALGSMAIHMLVPALPMVAGELGLTSAQAQRAIGIYLIGLGGGQLVAGPAADRIGRQPVLMAGMALYLLGAAGCAVAGSLPALLGWRLLQAMGGAAGIVTARVLVGDLYGSAQAAEKQASLMTIVLISPALAPLVGGFLADSLGWRAIPALLGLGAVGALVLAQRHLQGVAMVAPSRHGANLRSDYARLIGNRRFALATAAMALASSTLYTFLGFAPFLLHGAGLAPRSIGLALLTIAAASIGGTRLVAPLAQRPRTQPLLIGTGAVLLGAGAVAGLALCNVGLGNAGAGSMAAAASLVAPMVLAGLGAGIAGPSAMGLVLFAEKGLAGTASALAGAAQMLVSAAATLAYGLLGPPNAVSLGLWLAAFATLSFGAAWACLRGRAHRADVLA